MVPGSTILTDLYSPIRQELAGVERVFDDELFSSEPFVNQLCSRLQNYHGKMLRPALLLLWGKACGALRGVHHTLAAVVEMVHLATLVHDDVLDEAEVRRQHPTFNATSGNNTAVLLGDYLITHAYSLCSSLDDPYAARTISATTNTVCEGELMQVSLRNHPEVTEERYCEIIGKKTASLTGTCCALGARYSGGDSECVRAARKFGAAAGTAFQIVDDLLDLIGDQADTGKTMGRDLAFGNATLPIIHALASMPPASRCRLRAVVSGESVAPTHEVRRWLEQAGSIEYAYDRGREYVRRAMESLNLLPDSPARESLGAMAEFILRRHY